ncbi:AAA ATPase [Blastocladiella emersonii ATCC 22665]|nr:AAA ATPase [Blastocladiella emersonii ATCC 22665]
MKLRTRKRPASSPDSPVAAEASTPAKRTANKTTPKSAAPAAATRRSTRSSRKSTQDEPEEAEEPESDGEDSGSEEVEAVAASEKDDDEDEPAAPPAATTATSTTSQPDLVPADTEPPAAATPPSVAEPAIEIVGRTAEREQISAFLARHLSGTPSPSPVPASLYVAGSPGGGKTALVTQLLRAYPSPGVAHVLVNCMGLSSPNAVFGVLWQRLADVLPAPARAKGKRAAGAGAAGWGPAPTAAKAQAALGELVAQSDRPCAVVLDELDALYPGAMGGTLGQGSGGGGAGSGAGGPGTGAGGGGGDLASTHPTVLYALFALAHRCPSRFVLIGIANSLDLTQRLLPHLTGALAPGVVTFAAYSEADLEAILAARFAGDMLPMAAKFIARKIAAGSSDVRRALTIARTAVRLAKAKGAVANVPHVVQALKVGDAAGGGAAQSAVVKVRALNLTAKMVLAAAVAAVRPARAKQAVAAAAEPVAVPFVGQSGGSQWSQEAAEEKKPAAVSTKSNALTCGDLYDVHYSRLLDSRDLPIPRISEAEFLDVVMRLETNGLLEVRGDSSAGVGPTGTAGGRRRAIGSGAASGMRSALVVLAVTADEAVRGLTTVAGGGVLSAEGQAAEASHCALLKRILEGDASLAWHSDTMSGSDSESHEIDLGAPSPPAPASPSSPRSAIGSGSGSASGASSASSLLAGGPPTWLAATTAGESPQAMFAAATFDVVVPQLSAPLASADGIDLDALLRRETAVFDEVLPVYIAVKFPGSAPAPGARPGTAATAVRQALMERFAASLEIAVQVTVGEAQPPPIPTGRMAHPAAAAAAAAQAQQAPGQPPRKWIHQSSHVYSRRTPGSAPLISVASGLILVPMRVPVAYVDPSPTTHDAALSLMVSVAQTALTVAAQDGEDGAEDPSEASDAWMPDTHDAVNLVRGLALRDSSFARADISIAKARSHLDATRARPRSVAAAESPTGGYRAAATAAAAAAAAAPPPRRILHHRMRAVNALRVHVGCVAQRERDDVVLLHVGLENVLPWTGPEDAVEGGGDDDVIKILACSVRGAAGKEDATRGIGDAGIPAALAPGDQVDLAFAHTLTLPRAALKGLAAGAPVAGAEAVATAAAAAAAVEDGGGFRARSQSRAAQPQSAYPARATSLSPMVSSPVTTVHAPNRTVPAVPLAPAAPAPATQGAIRATVSVVYARERTGQTMASQWECTLANPLPLFRSLAAVTGASASRGRDSRPRGQRGQQQQQHARSPSPTRAGVAPPRTSRRQPTRSPSMPAIDTVMANSNAANSPAPVSPGSASSIMQKFTLKKRLSMTEEAILSMTRTFSFKSGGGNGGSTSRPTSPVRAAEDVPEMPGQQGGPPPRRGSSVGLGRRGSAGTSPLPESPVYGGLPPPPALGLPRDESHDSLAGAPAAAADGTGGALVVTLSVAPAVAGSAVRCGDEFYLSIQIINRTPVAREFAVRVPASKLVPEESAESAAVAPSVGLLDEAAFDALARAVEVVEPAIMCLDHDVRVAPVAPGQVTAVRVRFQALRAGVHPVGSVDLVDVGPGAPAVAAATEGVDAPAPIQIRDALAVLVSEA